MSNPFISTSWFNVAHLKPRLRGHVTVRRHRYRGQVFYVIDDGAAGRVHRFAKGAYLFVGRLDGERTVEQLWNRLVDELGEEAPTQDEVIAALGTLHASDLLASDIAPETGDLFDRQRRQKRQLWMQNLKSPMSLRLPLVDPDRFLNHAIAYVRPLLGWGGLALWLAVVLPAIVVAASHWGELTHNIVDRILAAQNLLIVLLVYPVVKIIHELGHGIVAKANGREVREMGIMFLILMPVPYVDASAASALSSKWQRALVGAAGMIAETFVAALALYAWTMVEPGIVRAALFNVVVVAGISTVLVNANPLLRFDGYYILSDLIEIPNLGSRANRYWGYLAERYLLRGASHAPFDATSGERRWFLLYAPASFIARMIMLFGIAIAIGQRFFFVGVGIALWSLWSGLCLPVWKMYAQVVTGPQFHRNRKQAVRLAAGLTAVVLVGLFVVPVPHHAYTQGVIWLPEAARVRAGGDGVITSIKARDGDRVRSGQLLIEAAHPTLDAEVDRLRGRYLEMRSEADAQLDGDRVKREVGTIEMEAARNELAAKSERLNDLDVRARTSGQFALASLPADDLPGRFVKEGDLIGYVTPGQAQFARVAVSQHDIELVRGHLDSLSFKVADRPEQTWRGQIVREVPGATRSLPSQALASANGGLFPLDPAQRDGQTALERVFLFDIALPEQLRDSPFGSRVYVRFALSWEPLGWQVARRIRQLLLARFGA